MPDFPMKLVDQPEIRCAGMKVRTTMANAGKDCPALWNDRFGPRMEEFAHDPAHPDECYGVSVMIDDERFDYWALDSLAPGADVPQGMEEYVIPEGRYAECSVPSLESLGECYQYVYGTWLPENRDLDFDSSRPCYELYGKDYKALGVFFLFVPVKDA